MDLDTVIFAVGFVLILEGLAFAAFPAAMKRAMGLILNLSFERLRFLGFVALFLGFVVIWFNWG